jgi:hypothetical protein
MALWEFGHLSFPELLEIRKSIEKFHELGIYLDKDMIAEVNAEIERTKNAKGTEEYRFIVHFVSFNNDTYNTENGTIYLYECPKDRKEVKEMVERACEGVWEPLFDTIQVYALTPVI